jgi:hypothetical protein
MYEKRTIKVYRRWQYTGQDPYREVQAFLVGGEEGVFAAWKEKHGDEEIICFATGDDGFWREVAGYHITWVPAILTALGLAQGEK